MSSFDTATTVYLGLGRSALARQIGELFCDAHGFRVLGSSAEAAILERDVLALERVPGIVLLSTDLLGRPLSELVELLVRRLRARVVVLGFPGAPPGSLDAALAAGAVHAEEVATTEIGLLDDRRAGRLFHLLRLFSEVRRPDSLELPAVRLSGAGRLLAAESGGRDVEPAASGQERGRRLDILSSAARSLRNSQLADYLMVGVVSSTGGLSALETVLSVLPHDYPFPVAITQHLRQGTDHEFVRLLRQHTQLSVELAVHGLRPRSGVVYVAPSTAHLRISSEGHLALTEEPKDSVFMPSATVLLSSMARVYGPRCVGVVLTGMGDDGAEGLLEIRKAGGRTLVQDKETSKIFGMPQAAIALRAAERVLPLAQIGEALCRLGQRS
ncbi:MAG: CheB methylesterase domain-containing protein [Myxococcota bacterium]|jgi:chemotaxis response regulator CheB|nr:CheB methylesterase domain-containing protein [Myxococcota bacterium]